MLKSTPPPLASNHKELINQLNNRAKIAMAAIKENRKTAADTYQQFIEYYGLWLDDWKTQTKGKYTHIESKMRPAKLMEKTQLTPLFMGNHINNIIEDIINIL